MTIELTLGRRRNDRKGFFPGKLLSLIYRQRTKIFHLRDLLLPLLGPKLINYKIYYTRTSTLNFEFLISLLVFFNVIFFIRNLIFDKFFFLPEIIFSVLPQCKRLQTERLK